MEEVSEDDDDDLREDADDLLDDGSGTGAD